ncbi:putative Enoyl reductase (ER) domain-containing protein [Seiridium unicorne]|uniref:D-xylulose reductase n=1 Tax=Seiridium unicorne TaxID=138068 RepID=A0ABR2UZL5_9PEZI
MGSLFARKDQPSHVEALNLPPNTSCLLLKKRTVSVEPIPLPILQPDGLLVKVISNGICGSDMHAYLAGGVGGRLHATPTVMGHEAAGEVIAVGEYVTTHKPGDRVAKIRYCGAPGTHGSLSRFFALPADMAPHIPESVGWDEAGSIQPLAIGVQIGKRADLRAHQTIAIFGCGPIGLITAAVAHAYSVKKIIAFDINPGRVEFARKYISPLTGKPIINHVIHIGGIPSVPSSKVHKTNGHAGENGEIPVADIDEEEHEETIGDIRWELAQARMTEIIRECGLESEEGVDRVIEASGSDDAMLHGIAICKQGGVFLQVGLGHIQTHLMPTIAITNKELDVRGITRYTASCFPSAIDLLARGVVDLRPLITAKFPLSRAKDAFEAVASGKEMKVIIKNQEV